MTHDEFMSLNNDKLPFVEPVEPMAHRQFAILRLRGFCTSFYDTRQDMERWSEWMKKEGQPHTKYRYSETERMYLIWQDPKDIITSDEVASMEVQS